MNIQHLLWSLHRSIVQHYRPNQKWIRFQILYATIKLLMKSNRSSNFYSALLNLSGDLLEINLSKNFPHLIISFVCLSVLNFIYLLRLALENWLHKINTDLLTEYIYKQIQLEFSKINRRLEEEEKLSIITSAKL